MTASSVHPDPVASPAAVKVRLCDECGRPVPALHKNEYTRDRARLVARQGLCVCPPAGADGVARIPDRGPSLL
jgi:hypothetical protein